LYELIGSSAEGNPFYMEELVKMLVDEGAIDTRGERWNLVPGRLRTLLVPQTLTGVLQARLDALKPAEKLALQQASIIGFVFWDQALAAIDGQATAPLPDLTERAMVIAHPEARLDGLHEYAFHHQILHHVTYDTVLKRLRREYHAKVAAWLAGRTGTRANAFLGATAEHYEKGGDNRRACEFYARAAEHAAGARARGDVELRGTRARPDGQGFGSDSRSIRLCRRALAALAAARRSRTYARPAGQAHRAAHRHRCTAGTGGSPARRPS
jgi:predicted ATPase